ncbi:tyrosine--tRNA ligase [Candidatus Daviesbacteria bacterium]|nr:tyrosine--tRNA ligase [Candidatus Daviesbacteria bacterium]
MATHSPEINREAQIQEFLTRGVQQVLPSQESLVTQLRSGRILKAYMGIDPTAPELHIGHVSQLHKLERLRRMGHDVTLLIGDFTGMIGDPTDKSAARVKLSPEQVAYNAATYKDQASKILNFDDPINPIRLKFNSEWLGEMNFEDVLELASEMTVQRMLERDMFERRIQKGEPVRIHEFLYPLMQGWDSVKLDVDIEVGGNDQIFNMMVGRDLVEKYLGKEKYVVAGKLLTDPSGRKIGKTEGNMVAVLDTPESMYHKVMMWGDQIVPHALELCTTVPMDQIRELEEALQRGDENPVKAKMFLARRIVSELQSPEAAEQAERAYLALSSGGLLGTVAEANFSPGTPLIDILTKGGFAPSRAAAKRLIEQGGVRFNLSTITDPKTVVKSPGMLQVGKRIQNSFLKINIEK